MSKQSIPNNPVVLLQRNVQILQTIISQADEHTPIVAFIAMQKNTIEAIQIMETHDKTNTFTIVPKQVVSLCRQTIAQNVETLKHGIADHQDDDRFVKLATAKLATYKNILDRLPTPEPKPDLSMLIGHGTTAERMVGDPPAVLKEGLVIKGGRKPPPSSPKLDIKPIGQKPSGPRSDVKLSAKTSFEVERKAR